MSESTHPALFEHARECDECRNSAPPLGELSARLDAGAAAVDAASLSRLVLARIAPELRARAQAVFWRRLVRALAAALLPLPLVIAADLWLLGWLYALIAAWLPSGLAVYLVASYAATLLVLIGSAYAAIPLLLARPVLEPDPAPA